MKTTRLTPSEKSRIAQIRRGLRKFKRQGVDTSSWEAEFFLGILDRFTGRNKS